MRYKRNVTEAQARAGVIVYRYVGLIAPVTARAKQAADNGVTDDDLSIGGIISRYGVEDSYGDVFLKGAFDPLPDFLPMLWMHRRAEVIGRWGELYQQKNDVRADGAIWREAPLRRRAVHDGLMTGLSVGAYIDEFSVSRRDDGFFGWDISKARLVEASVVDVPANPVAEIDVTDAADSRFSLDLLILDALGNQGR